jgi:vesicular inhibitory amino acid transporter
MTPFRDANQGFDDDAEEGETRPLLAQTDTKITEEQQWTPHSTYSQTIFNAVNILMGIGLLSLPFAFRLIGWVLGLSMLFLFAAMTRKTAGSVAKCLDAAVPSHLPFKTSCTFGDFGEVAFGLQGRGFISVVFVLELFAASVALVILTADSVVALFPNFDLDLVKACTVALILPATLPRSLSLASYGSLVGVLALVNLLLIVLFSGLWTLESPGSIRNPAQTFAFPENWMHVPLALGLVMSGFSGHSVFPSIYRDMIQPKQYPSMVSVSYIITTTIYVFIAVAGYLMFGTETREEISQNLPLVPSYNYVLIQITIWLVALNSMTKYPLAIFPVNAQMERVLLGRSCLLFRVSGCILLVSILLPGFHYIMAILGSLFCFTVSIVFPESCYLVLYKDELGAWERFVSWSLIIFGALFGLIGTVWAFIPMDI